MTQTGKAYLAITLQSTIVGFTYLMTKICLEYSNPMEILAHRFTVAFLAILLYRLYNPKLFKVSFKVFLEVLPYTLFYPFLFFSTQVIALDLNSSAQVGIVYSIVPVVTMIAARMILTEKITGNQFLFMLLSIFGVLYINLKNGNQLEGFSPLGFWIVIVSCISLALYNVLTRKIASSYPVTTIVYVMITIGFISFNLISIGQNLYRHTLPHYFEPFLHWEFVLSIIFLGVCASVVTSALTAYTLRTLDSTKVSLINNLSTIISIISGVVFLHESLYFYHYIGILLIFIGTIGYNLIGNKKLSPE